MCSSESHLCVYGINYFDRNQLIIKSLNLCNTILNAGASEVNEFIAVFVAIYVCCSFCHHTIQFPSKCRCRRVSIEKCSVWGFVCFCSVTIGRGNLSIDMQYNSFARLVPFAFSLHSFQFPLPHPPSTYFEIVTLKLYFSF